MKKGSYVSSTPYGIKYNERNDVFRIVYSALEHNHLKVVDVSDLVTNDNFLIKQKNILIDNADFYLAYMKKTDIKAPTPNGQHYNMKSGLQSMLNVKDSKNQDIIFSFTTNVHINMLLSQIRQQQKI